LRLGGCINASERGRTKDKTGRKTKAQREKHTDHCIAAGRAGSCENRAPVARDHGEEPEKGW